MASARCWTRDRKNSWPMPAAVPSTTACRARRSSGTSAADVSLAPALRWPSRVATTARFGSKVMPPLHDHEPLLAFPSLPSEIVFEVVASADLGVAARFYPLRQGPQCTLIRVDQPAEMN